MFASQNKGDYMMHKVGFVSLGCPKNLVDTENMLGILVEKGIEITNNPDEADVLIVNTCGFIDSAKEESITTILQMAQYKDSGRCKGLIVTGCLSQRYADELKAEMPEIDAIIGTYCYDRIYDIVTAVLNGEKPVLVEKNYGNIEKQYPRILTTPSYTAYLKIAEGCSNCCSYCVIPHIRGSFRSRPIEMLVDEAKKLAESGVRELIVIAQDTTNYGSDLYGAPKLTELLKSLCQIDQIQWIRLMYCYPNNFNDELIALIKNEHKLLKYIDLPLQHAHNDILKMMNRKDTRENIEKLLDKLRTNIPDIAIRTSFIVGFPGETDEHFVALKEFIKAQRFDRVGVFTYSQEEGTLAAVMENQISEEVKQARFHELMSIQSKISEEINISYEDKVLDILIEGSSEKENLCIGRSYREAPDIDGTIYIEKAGTLSAGQFVKAKIVQGFTYDLVAEKI